MADVYFWFVVFKNFSVCEKASCVLFVSAGVVREFDVIFNVGRLFSGFFSSSAFSYMDMGMKRSENVN